MPADPTRVNSLIAWCDAELKDALVKSECKSTVERIAVQPETYTYVDRDGQNRNYYSWQRYMFQERQNEPARPTGDHIYSNYTAWFKEAFKERDRLAPEQVEKNALLKLNGAEFVKDNFIAACKQDFYPPLAAQIWMQYVCEEEDLPRPQFRKGEQTKYWLPPVERELPEEALSKVQSGMMRYEGGRPKAVITEVSGDIQAFIKKYMSNPKYSEGITYETGNGLAYTPTPTTILKMFTKLRPCVPKRLYAKVTLDPYEILMKSTDKPFVSCEKPGAEQYEHGVFSDIANWNGIALMTLEGNTRPSSRVMLRQCVNENGQPDVGMEDILQTDKVVKLNDGNREDSANGIYKYYGDEATARAGLQLVRQGIQSGGYFRFKRCVTPGKYAGYADVSLYRYAAGIDSRQRGMSDSERYIGSTIVYGEERYDPSQQYIDKWKKLTGIMRCYDDTPWHSTSFVQMTPENIAAHLQNRRINDGDTFEQASNCRILKEQPDDDDTESDIELRKSYTDWKRYPEMLERFKAALKKEGVEYLVYTTHAGSQNAASRILDVNNFTAKNDSDLQATYWNYWIPIIKHFHACRYSEVIEPTEQGGKPNENWLETCLQEAIDGIDSRGKLAALTTDAVGSIRSNSNMMRDLCANLDGYYNRNGVNDYLHTALSQNIYTSELRGDNPPEIKALIKKCRTKAGLDENAGVRASIWVNTYGFRKSPVG